MSLSRVSRFIVVIAFTGASLFAADRQAGKPPTTAVHDATDTYFGVTIKDPYRWLEDQNSPETRTWIDRQNAYTQKVLSEYTGRAALREQIAKVMEIDSINTPIRRGDRYFYLRRRADQNLDMLCVREKEKETVLVDPNTLTPDASTSVVIEGGSEDGKLLAYGLRKGGADETTVAILEVSSRRPLPDTFPAARYGSFDIAPDHKTMYYAKYTPGIGPRVYMHIM